MLNFDYLKDIPELHTLYDYCHTAELYQRSDREKSALNARKALEWIVRAIYRLKHVDVAERTSLFTLIDGEPFTSFVGDEKMMMAVHYVRKAGNMAAHSGGVTGAMAFFALLNIYNVVGGILKKLQVVSDFPPFDRSLIPATPGMHVEPPTVVAPAEDFVESVCMDSVAETPVEQKPTGISEAETRKLFIDMMLLEAGWEVLDRQGLTVPAKAGIEIEIQGMPTPSGTGRADYVLFGDDGKPLAVVEAKRTSHDITQGQQQAKLYADSLERQYGTRPVVYCSNGYHTEVTDGLGYPSRTVYGFHSKQELQLLIQRRARKPIASPGIRDDISGREYQKRAIRKVCERLNGMHRRSLLVMATGTGKTRVSISLSDVLERSGWVKNILFLADRTSLVNQAAKNYAKLLPEYTTTILSEDKEPNMEARIMFSTYQTMIKRIDSDTKDFTIGRFDMIIVDEAHRSVFGKYTAIFHYFDAFLVGLTATPREEIDRNTFDLFGTEAEDAFAYEYQEAVADGYLVDYVPFKRSTKILKKGIRYEELDEESQVAMEPVWQYEKARRRLDPQEAYSRDIESQEIFKYIFNEDTIDKVVQDLMTHGLHVESGDKIGKTIIFAYNHRHAELIVQRFKALYPHLGDDFCVLIDNYVNYAQTLIDRLEVRGGLPQIAVSVDMLDTGIDVPDILNLVFFKPVQSKIKITQMIGRGTRLSPDIFGPGQDKKEFYIFDWCGNFDFFEIFPNGKEAKPVQGITERIFCLKADIAYILQQAKYQTEPFSKQLHDELKAELHTKTTELRDNIIAVRENWPLVDRFRKAEAWTCLTPEELADVKNHLAPLILPNSDDESAKKFDVLMLNIELSMIDPTTHAQRAIKNVVGIARLMLEKASIPQIKAKLPTIQQVAAAAFWDNVSMDSLERVRTELRELMKFLLDERGRVFTIDIEDEVIDEGVAEKLTPTTYKQRIIDYLAEHRDLPVIRKIQNIEQLTHEDIEELERILWEELGTKVEYARYVSEHNMMCGDSVAAFIRAQIGVDQAVALQRFSQFLSDTTLNADQEEYLKDIIAYVSRNGDITTEIIMTDATFRDNAIALFGNNVQYIGQYVNALHHAILI